MVKQFMLLKGQGKAASISPDWEEDIRKLADAFVATWNECGTWGNYIDVKTGKVSVYNTTNGAMMALEIPGIYLRTDNGSLYVFDHVEAQIVKQNNKQTVLQITNPTVYDAIVTIFAESAEEASRPLGDNAFLRWKDKVTVKAGKTVRYKLNN